MTELASRSRLIDLLVARSTQGLNQAELAEFSQIGPLHPDLSPDHFDRAAAAIALTEPTDGVDMPKNLQSLVLSQAVVALEGANQDPGLPAPSNEADAARLERERLADRSGPPDKSPAAPDLEAGSTALETAPSASQAPPETAEPETKPTHATGRGSEPALVSEPVADKPRVTEPAVGPYLSEVRDANLKAMPEQPAAATATVAQPTPPRPAAAVEPVYPRAARAAQSSSSGLPAWTGWAAAAAVLLLATLGAIPRLLDRGDASAPAVAENLEQLPDTRSIGFDATDDPAAAGARGEVIWNPRRQEGYMHFSGLPINDPVEYQYQLWIFDSLQDERYPIDGGVFNIDREGEVTVEIDAKLVVVEPTLFAVTIEKPGGVVVSSRDRIVLAAAVS